ncbi:hypothetical protein [Actibacterium ureilyticum]|uniref:hypothetical protein n=1 Tax=Actibacterium ureilyticum TaxID=1590614 RepID=UPI000BAA98C8|nr:hypothetical protein [Actibacterium ureilyticum]
MSNSDSFIDEVTEEVRRDQLYAKFRRYGWIAVLAVLLLVGGAAYSEWQKARAQAAAQALGDNLIAALGAPDTAARAAALDALALDAAPGALRDLLAAGEESTADDRSPAIDRLTALADDSTAPVVYRHLAALKAVWLMGQDSDADQRRALLQPLSQAGQPFAPLAQEQLALIAVETGDTAAAVAQLRDLINSTEASVGLRQRAAQLMVALGEDPGA